MFGGSQPAGGGGFSRAEATSSFTNYPVAPAFDWQPVVVFAAVAGLVLVALVFVGKIFSK